MRKYLLLIFSVTVCSSLCACDQLATTAGLRDSAIFHHEPYRETAWQEALAQERQFQLFNALEAYYMTFGHYPAELAELQESGLATAAELASPLGVDFYYQRLLTTKNRQTTSKHLAGWILEKEY